MEHLVLIAKRDHAPDPIKAAQDAAVDALNSMLRAHGLDQADASPFYASPAEAFVRQPPSDMSKGDGPLSNLARRLEAQPAATTFLERAFSAAGRQDSRFRARLSHTSRRALLLLAMNGFPETPAPHTAAIRPRRQLRMTMKPLQPNKKVKGNQRKSPGEAVEVEPHCGGARAAPGAAKGGESGGEGGGRVEEASSGEAGGGVVQAGGAKMARGRVGAGAAAEREGEGSESSGTDP